VGHYFTNCPPVIQVHPFSRPVSPRLSRQPPIGKGSLLGPSFFLPRIPSTFCIYPICFISSVRPLLDYFSRVSYHVYYGVSVSHSPVFSRDFVLRPSDHLRQHDSVPSRSIPRFSPELYPPFFRQAFFQELFLGLGCYMEASHPCLSVNQPLIIDFFF